MNSWEMIKGSLTKGHTPTSVGYLIEVNKAAKLFVGLRNILGDFPVAVETFNADVEVGKALSKNKMINEFKEAGLI